MKNVTSRHLRGKQIKSIFDLIENLGDEKGFHVVQINERHLILETWDESRPMDNEKPDLNPLRRDKKQHGRVTLSNPNGNIYMLHDRKGSNDPFAHVRIPSMNMSKSGMSNNQDWRW